MLKTANDGLSESMLQTSFCSCELWVK